MAHLTRRAFMTSATVGGAAIALASVPALGATIEEVEAQSLGKESAHLGPLVAYVHNASKDEVSLMVGTRKVIIRDRKLVARLVRAAR